MKNWCNSFTSWKEDVQEPITNVVVKGGDGIVLDQQEDAVVVFLGLVYSTYFKARAAKLDGLYCTLTQLP